MNTQNTNNPHLDQSWITAIFAFWFQFPNSFWIMAEAPASHPLEWAFVVQAIKALAED